MSGTAVSPFRQPKAVFAVAFACVVSFMGIGLVDPILPAISHQLNASPSQVTLLFTSYLVVTALAMLITNWVSSRLGAKRTLIAGLALIVVFSALAGTSGSIGGIIGFRAGWGIGNALFIATSLAVIVACASGGFTGAIVLYETALGLGIAVGPLLGGVLGEISWRGPFYGVAALMAIALIATVVLVQPTARPARKTGLSEPLRALRHRGLFTMSLTALCYNWGFFTVLGYAPFPMNLSPIKLGLVFTGWGTMVAIFAVFGAPRLQGRFGIAATMYANLAAFAVAILVIAIWTTDRSVLIPAVIISGIFIGINNTITTQAVMTIAPVERPVASAAYSFVRFIGGGLAPYAAGRLVLSVNIHFPFYLAAGAVAAGILILSTVHKALGVAERAQAEEVRAAASPGTGTGTTGGPPAGPTRLQVTADGVTAAASIPATHPGADAAADPATAGTTTGAVTTVTAVTAGAAMDGPRPGVIVAAVDDSPVAGLVITAAARIAGPRGRVVHVVHVPQPAIGSDTAVDGEDLRAAGELVAGHLQALAEGGVPAHGQLLLHAGDHGAVGRLIAEYARDLGATTIVLGAPRHGGLATLMDASTSQALLRAARTHVLIVNPDAPAAPAGPVPDATERQLVS